MNDSLEHIRRYVTALVTRERLLLLARIGLQLAGLIVGLVLLALLAPLLRWELGVAALVLVVVGGAGLWAAVFAPLLLGWRRSGDRLRQARLAEALRPELEGRLLTSVERLQGPRGNESAAILGLIARRAQERLTGLRPSRVHRAWPLGAAAGGVFLAALITLVTALVVPGGVLGAASFWLGGEEALAEVASPTKGSSDVARVGDLVLEYVYPTYTGLDPLEVTNSTGEAHGPPGTQVRIRARSAEPIDGGAVFAYGESQPDSSVQDRIVSGSFIIGEEEGTWHLELLQGESTRVSRDFEISPEPDLPPEVMVEAPPRLEVAVDAPLDLPWQARDDFGLTRVALFLDSNEASELRAFTDRTAESAGVIRFTPAELGMSPGMTVKLQVGAFDNNGWSGAQLGRNEPPITLVVKRAEELSVLGVAERASLRDTLVDLLGGQLMDAWPPAGTSAAVARSGERFHDLYEPLERLLDDTPAIRRDRQVRRMLLRVRRSGQDFVTYTQVNFDPRVAESVVGSETLSRATELRDLAIEENEHTIVWLDRFIQMFALGRAMEESQTLARLGSKLERELERGASDAEIASALERVERSLKELERATGSMNQDSTRQMIERRTREIGLLRETTAQAQAQGNRDEAARMAERMAGQMKELQEDLEYRMRRMEDEEDQLGQEMKALHEELSRLEREQRLLQEEVRKVRESGDAQGSAEAERMWAQVEKLAAEANERGTRLAEGVDRSGGLFMFQQRVEAANGATSRLQESAAARDLRKARRDLNEAMDHWMRAQSGVPEASRKQIMRRLEQAQRLLDQLDRAASSVDPRTAAQARALESRQSDLDEALKTTRGKAQQVAAKMPIEPRGMLEALQQADQSMGQAGQDLEQGRPMPAEGAQGQAAERIKEAREALEQAAQQMASSGEGARSGGEPGEGDEGGNGDESEENEAELDLDGDRGTLHRGPLTLEGEFDLDAFQRDVLRGAGGDVPEAYRAMKKRYYEELMTQ